MKAMTTLTTANLFESEVQSLGWSETTGFRYVVEFRLTPDGERVARWEFSDNDPDGDLISDEGYSVMW